jgi:hypothetical protein
MRRHIGWAVLALVLGAGGARAQVPDVVGAATPGDPSGRRLGWMVSNGFGYGAIGPRGPGYYTGLDMRPFNEDGQSVYYNPIFNSLNTGPGSYVEPSKRGTTLVGRIKRRFRGR